MSAFLFATAVVTAIFSSARVAFCSIPLRAVEFPVQYVLEDVSRNGGIVPGNYNALIPPTSSGGPVHVEFSVLIMNIRDVIELSQEVTLEMNLHIYWVDSRLQNLTDGKEFLVVNAGALAGHIWTPDVFIDHTKAINQPALMSKPESLRLYSNGGLRYSERVSATISCPMNFRLYPADIQRCAFDLKSYAYPNNIVSVGWHKIDGAKLLPGLDLPNYYLSLEQPEDYVISTSSGFYSGIRFRIKLERRMSYHIIQTYMPSIMFIMISWLTFVIPQDTGAVMICMTTLLTITAMFASVRQSTPVVSYTKAIDIWMAVCMVYLFISLIQHIVTVRLRHMKVFRTRDQRQPHPFLEVNTDPPVETDPSVLSVSFRMKGDSFRMQNLNNQQPQGEDNPNDVARRYARNIPTSPPPPVPSAEDNLDQDKINEYKVLGNKIRRMFSVVAPASFLLFNIIYWAWLLNAAQ